VPWEGTAQSLQTRDPHGEVVLKTFTMGDGAGGYVGGAAGWLDPRTRFWLRGPGKGAAVIGRWFDELRVKFTSADGEGPGLATSDQPQVCTNFLSRYSVTVVRAEGGVAADPGPLYGDFVASLKHGTTARFTSRGNVFLKKRGAVYHLGGCFTLDDYIARVIQREGGTLPVEARKALAVVARTYLLQQATRWDDNHLYMPDSTRWQRVSIDEPSRDNRHIAATTTGLILNGEVFFHQDQAGEDTFSLTASAHQAGDGLQYDEILAIAFPALKIVPLWSLKEVSCDELAVAGEWLRFNLDVWKKDLIPLGADMEAPTTVCHNRAHKAFYFDKRIYMADFQDTEDQITLVHEWLHAAFAATPLGEDEGRIEGLAKRLVLGE
jgi:uncharacterized protein YfaQ (DUF2300 family)